MGETGNTPISLQNTVGCYARDKYPGGCKGSPRVTLTAADLLTIVGAIFGTLLIVGGGALAWLRADIARLDERQRSDNASLRAELAKLDERQRADTAAINMRLDALTQAIITSAIARGPQADVPAEGAGKAVRAGTAAQA